MSGEAPGGVQRAELLAPALQGALASVSSLGTALAMFPSTEWALSHRRAVAVAAAATGALAVVLLVRRARRRAAQPRRKLDEEEESDYEEEEAAITTLAQLRALRAPLLPLAAPAVASVCVTGHSLHLAAFPPALCALRCLRELDLRGNAIPALPAGVGRLVQLTRCGGGSASLGVA